MESSWTTVGFHRLGRNRSLGRGRYVFVGGAPQFGALPTAVAAPLGDVNRSVIETKASIGADAEDGDIRPRNCHRTHPQRAQS